MACVGLNSLPPLPLSWGDGGSPWGATVFIGPRRYAGGSRPRLVASKLLAPPDGRRPCRRR